jgi:S-adenosylmethionine hydrolase
VKHPVVTLTTDFGTSDHYVAAMKGVILGICPGAALVDISHTIPPYSILDAAWVIGQAWRSFPRGTVHLIVVDPGVGSERRALVAEVEGYRFVAPDNGVLTMVLDAAKSSRVRQIAIATYFRRPVSQTFHGRDIFAPVAARVAAGLAASRLGPLIEDAVRLPTGSPRQTGQSTWEGTVLHVDQFGNVVTNFSLAEWPGLDTKPFRLKHSKINISQAASTYAAMIPGKLCLISGSSGYWEVSCNQQDAGKILCAKAGHPLKLRLLPK